MEFQLASAVLQAAADRFLDIVVAHSPVRASHLGLHERDGDLDEFDAGAATSEGRDLANLLRTIGKTASYEDPDDQIDANALISMIETRIFELENERQWERNPALHIETLLEGVFAIAQRDYAPLHERANSLVARLDAGARLLRNIKATIVNPPAIWVDNAIRTAEAGPAFITGPIAAIAAKMTAVNQNGLASDLERVSKLVAHELESCAQWMRDELLPRAAGEWAVGESGLRTRLATEHRLSESPEELMQIGREMIAEIGDRLEREAAAQCRSLGIDGGWRELLDLLKSDTPEPDELLGIYQREMERSQEWVRESGVAPISTDAPLLVEETPAFLQHLVPFAAYSPPGPFESVQSGFFWITPSKAAGAMRDHCKGTPPLIAAHEGFPGHHLQLTHSNRLERTVRRLQWSTLLIEGWGFYCEQLLADSEIGDSTSRLLGLKDQLWRACRVVLDIGIHTGEIDLDEATSMLVEIAGLEPAGAEAEVRRYTSSPGYQVSYAIGKRTIADLAAAAQVRLGSDYDDGRFHEALLDYGSIPPALFSRQLLDNIEPGNSDRAAIVTGALEVAREQLLARITELNERCWLAIWKYDIEFELWQMVTDGTGGDYGMSQVTADELSDLADLADLAGGWFVDLCEVPLEDQQLTFVPIDEWRARWREIASEVRQRRIRLGD